MSPNAIALAVIVPLLGWRLYARTRRNFGRQLIRPRRMWARVGIFALITLLVATTGFAAPRLAAGLAVGCAGGFALGWVALKFTRFEITGSDDCYYPNPWIGVALTALFVGRLLYRFVELYPLMTGAAGGHFAYQRSPLTLAILGLLLGYYVAYYAGLLLHHRRELAAHRAAA
jgi:hypothetical protein